MHYSKLKTWIILSVLATLLLGFILGMLTDRIISIKKCRQWLLHKEETAQFLTRENLVSRLSRKLDLSKSQVQTIGGILRQKSVKLNEIRTRHKKQVNLTMNEMSGEIKNHLTISQRKKFDKLIQVHRERCEKALSKSWL